MYEIYICNIHNILNKIKSNKINEKNSPLNLWAYEVKFFELRDRWESGQHLVALCWKNYCTMEWMNTLI
jgi:hypothetical protein